MKNSITFCYAFFLLLLCSFNASRAFSGTANKASLSYYLQHNNYNPNVPTPESVLGFQVGEWHVRPDQLVNYMSALSKTSDRVSMEVFGHSHERRPLILLTISSPENIKDIDSLRLKHLSATEQSNEKPLIIWMGYSVHGDEASGANASLLFAYHLAASMDETLVKQLDNVVVLMEPMLNPDGGGRFANWVNSNRSIQAVGDRSNREHQQGWLTGRTNHYWFDLNRDWLLLQHPESQARIQKFHHWKPHVLTDFHEMGTGSSFFFQPGVRTRVNPLTSKHNYRLTQDLANINAKAMDDIGSSYFTGEIFDDYYYGKGSSYPDANGTIGILFEQASARGIISDSSEGQVSFPFAIKNQLTASLSTINGAYKLKTELLKYRAQFAKESLKLATKDKIKASIFSEPSDPVRLAEFIDILLQHQIRVYRLERDLNVNGQSFQASNTYVVPYSQTQYRILKSLFAKITHFKDSTFYDVSTWTLPLSFNINYENLTRGDYSNNMLGERILKRPSLGHTIDLDAKIAYVISWENFNAPSALYNLLNDGIKVKVATRKFSSNSPTGIQNHKTGDLLIHLASQNIGPKALEQKLSRLALDKGLTIQAINSGLSTKGIDLGSNKFVSLTLPKVLMLSGPGTSSVNVGELWHLLDTKVEMPVTIVDTSKFNAINLHNYTHLLIPDGRYRKVSKKQIRAIRRWIKNGGSLIGIKNGAKWMAVNNIGTVTIKKNKKVIEPKRKNYAEMDKQHAKNLISGAIFKVHLDTSHPLAYGYKRSSLPVFKDHKLIMQVAKNPFETVAQYDKSPLISGYASTENEKNISNSAMMIGQRSGKGTIIYILDNPTFRGIWYGTNRLLINSIFLSSAIKADPSR